MNNIQISDDCNGCGICTKHCPFDAIEVKDNKAIILEGCTLCGSCEDACPADAITIVEKETDINLDDYQDVWVFGETSQGELNNVVYELIGEGRKLADKLNQNLCVTLFGDDLNSQAKELINYGVDKVYLVESEKLITYNDEYYTSAMTELINSYKPSILLLGATARGRSLGPRVATRIDTGLTADCTALDIDDETSHLLQRRPAFSGNIMATIVCKHNRPQMATVRPGVFKAASRKANQTGQIIEHDFDTEDMNVKTEVIEIVEEIEDSINIDEADIIVSGGRGVGSAEDFQVIRDLAKAMDGAVGASRAAVDSGWIAQDHQVGQTGTTVSPTIYVACGISGAVQHLVGMKSSDIIIAINKDPEAPIFNHATYGLVGDLHEIVPLLVEKINNGDTVKEVSEVSEAVS